MTSTVFDEFVERQRREADDPFWPKQAAEYVASVADLYRLIEDFLSEYIENGSIATSRVPVQLTEEDTGTYTTEQLRIAIGRQLIELVPIGTQIIGAKGRIDVTGRAGTRRIALVDASLDTPRIRITVEHGQRGGTADVREPEWVWRIVAPSPRMSFLPLDRTTFMTLLMEVADA